MRARGLDEVAQVVVALSEAAGTALDPASILERTMAVLEPVVDLGQVTLWRESRQGTELAASHPSVPVDADVSWEEQSEAPGALVIPMASRGQAVGELVVRRGSGEPFGPNDRALIDIAGNQIAGALERVELFNEVMELERLKSDFIARVSHELRTPITIITGFLETLIAHGAALDTEGRLHMLERSRLAASRLGHLIEELLILSRIEGGVLTPALAAVPVAEALEEVRTASVEPDRVLVVGPLPPTIVTDRALLTRALGLVVDNAIKYGGTAEVSVSTGDAGATIEVRDHGSGFADDVRHTAFEMFTRSQAVAAVPGLGAGLAIARTIVEVLDGTIAIGDAQPGPGAVVRLSLPA